MNAAAVRHERAARARLNDDVLDIFREPLRRLLWPTPKEGMRFVGVHEDHVCKLLEHVADLILAGADDEGIGDINAHPDLF